ncbi:MAG: radical SAM protein [Phycisphaerae bacterium]|nr:radical SAM protein [Phycisphaerae bacterium]
MAVMTNGDEKSRLVRLALANLRSKFAEQLFVRTGLDFTRPVQIYAILTTRCNARCEMCTYWRDPVESELPAADWIRALRSLKHLSGSYHVQFCAAEALMRNDLFEILHATRAMGVTSGITTNGLLLNDGNIEKLLGAGIFNINVSIDSMNPEIHDSLRGVPGLLEKVKRNVENLASAIKRSGSSARIIIRPLVCTTNIDSVHEVVEFAKSVEAAGVNFQPMVKWSPESEKLMRIPLSAVLNLVERLTEMKRAGDPIMNSPASMQLWTEHFSGQIPSNLGICRVPLRNLSILSNGDVLLCQSHLTPLGNIATDDVGQMWRSQLGKSERRRITKQCDKFCTGTSTVRKSLRDYLNLFKRLS